MLSGSGRARVLELLAGGSSRLHAAAACGIAPSTLTRWLQRGAKAAPGGHFRTFYEAAVAAEGRPSLRALTDEWERTLADPLRAWRWLERHGAFDDPPEPPPVIELRWPDPNRDERA